MNRCPECNGRLKKQSIERTRHIGDYAFTTLLPGWVCAESDYTEFAAKDLISFDLRIAQMLLQAGISTPPVIKFLRQVTGMPAKELAALLGVRPETISRWESGKAKIDRPAYALLRQLIEERQAGRSEMAGYLASLRKPPRLAKKVRLPEAAYRSRRRA